MKHIQTGLSLVALFAMTVQASAGAMCDAGAAAALKTAAVQQELMVAGLMCGDTGAYNRFVLDYQSQLQQSDAKLMSWFRDRDGNEAGYDTYKTKLANLAAGKSSTDGARYCSRIDQDFAAATAHGQTLDNFIHADRLLIAAPEACAVQYDAQTQIAVAGVPSHDLPATLYGAAATDTAAPETFRPTEDRAPARRLADPDRRQAYNDLPRPPRYVPRDDGWDNDDNDSQASAYGPPPAWLPRPRRAWYSAYNDAE